MKFQKMNWAGMAALTVLAACHSHKTPQVTAQDVEAAKQEAQRAVEQARAEASKDVKSALKTGGGNPRETVRFTVSPSGPCERIRGHIS